MRVVLVLLLKLDVVDVLVTEVPVVDVVELLLELLLV